LEISYALCFRIITGLPSMGTFSQAHPRGRHSATELIVIPGQWSSNRKFFLPYPRFLLETDETRPEYPHHVIGEFCLSCLHFAARLILTWQYLARTPAAREHLHGNSDAGCSALDKEVLCLAHLKLRYTVICADQPALDQAFSRAMDIAERVIHVPEVSPLALYSDRFRLIPIHPCAEK
jgi:hypothetical protein